MFNPRALVCFLSDASLSDGCVGHTASLVSALQRAGCDVEVITLSSNGENFVGGQLLRAFPASGRGMVAAALATVAVVRRQRPDLLVCTSLGTPFNPFIALAARFARVPVLYDCQDPPVETMPLIFGRGVRGRLLQGWAAMTDIILRRSVSWALSVSRGVDHILRCRGWQMPIYRFYNAHGIVGIEGVEPAFGFRQKYGWLNAQVLVYAGGLQPRIRGIETQLEAVGAARQAGGDVKFMSFGAGDALPFLQLAETLGISQHIVIHEPLPRASLLSALRESDMAVLATLPFALPSKVFEYVACGLNVICDRSNQDVLDAFSDAVQTFDGTAVDLGRVILDLASRGRSHHQRRSLDSFLATNEASVAAIIHAIGSQ